MKRYYGFFETLTNSADLPSANDFLNNRMLKIASGCMIVFQKTLGLTILCEFRDHVVCIGF